MNTVFTSASPPSTHAPSSPFRLSFMISSFTIIVIGRHRLCIYSIRMIYIIYVYLNHVCVCVCNLSSFCHAPIDMFRGDH